MSYGSPRQKNYLNSKFIRQSKLYWDYLRRNLKDYPHWKFNSYWAYWGAAERRSLLWLPKIYVCVDSRDYWETVFKILHWSLEEPVLWKFSCDFKHFDRPDKIVIYCQSNKEIIRSLKTLNQFIAGAETHQLSHVGHPGDYFKGPFFRDLKGLYLGSDPQFLNMSWRSYRIAANQYLHKIKNSEVGFTDLNLSANNNGPASLLPSLKVTSKIQNLLLPILSQGA